MGGVWRSPGEHSSFCHTYCYLDTLWGGSPCLWGGCFLSCFFIGTLCAVTLCSKSSKSDAPKEKGKKAPRVWALGGSANKEALDYSAPTANGAPEGAPPEDINLVRGSRARVKANVNKKWGRKER